MHAQKTFYPVKIASGLSPLGTENSRWIVGNGGFTAEIVVCKCLAGLQVPQSRKKLEDWLHAPLRGGGNKFRSPSLLRIRSELEFAVEGNVLVPVKKSSQQ